MDTFKFKISLIIILLLGLNVFTFAYFYSRPITVNPGGIAYWLCDPPYAKIICQAQGSAGITPFTSVDIGAVNIATLASQSGPKWQMPAGQILRLWYFNGNDSLPPGFAGYCQHILEDFSANGHFIYAENFGVIGPKGDGITPVATYGPFSTADILGVLITNNDGSFVHTCSGYWTFTMG